VGKAKNLKKRVSSYFAQRKNLGSRTRAMLDKAEKIQVSIVESDIDALLLEANLIKKFSPKYNVKLTDGKAYPLIRITVSEQYPAVLFARRPEDSKSLYFGPYPSAGAMKLVLKTIRHIFPFVSVPHHKKEKCLYNHLGLCPCPQAVGTEEIKKAYKKNIKRIIEFLEGGRKQLIKDLEKERDIASKQEDFETAKVLQVKIDAMNYITKSTHDPFEYELNPNLRSDIRQKELDDLKNVLEAHGTYIENLQRIDCFDISNIQGHAPVGSMVTFIHGEKASAKYRRFKIIKTDGKPNDFAMMEEVVTRRLKHLEDWGAPDLIIVDGGKGQISSALKVLVRADKQIPLIGLAKREETIITSDFKEISLSKRSGALQLMMRIRDEAHRFAITYHRKLRSKYAFM
jgi:excinuclease ABC subunit C